MLYLHGILIHHLFELYSMLHAALFELYLRLHAALVSYNYRDIIFSFLCQGIHTDVIVFFCYLVEFLTVLSFVGYTYVQHGIVSM